MGCHPRLAAVRRGESSSWDTSCWKVPVSGSLVGLGSGEKEESRSEREGRGEGGQALQGVRHRTAQDGTREKGWGGLRTERLSAHYLCKTRSCGHG